MPVLTSAHHRFVRRRLLLPGRLLLVALLICAAALPAAASFTVQGRQLLRDGHAFQVRGVCYQPAPIGDNPSAAAPFGDYFTSNYGAITGRDLPLIRALGANVIRIYGWNATADHTAFLDACYNGGVDPIFVIVNRWIDPGTNWTSMAALDAIEQEFLQTDQGLGTHPAVLAIVLGNEANIHNGNGDNPAFWAAMNRFASAIKSQSPSRLVSVAITDSLPQIAAHNAAVPALDFWCVQTYRGTTLGSLFNDYAAASTKPLLLTEFGMDAFNQTTGAPYPDNAALVGETVAGLWTEIAANAEVCAGACVFEFADEWWKTPSGSASSHDSGGFALPGLPDGFANEEWWGLYAIADNGAGLDILTPRATVAALRAAWTPVTPVEPGTNLAVLTPPVSQTIAPGGAATLEVSVTGQAADSTLVYQWFRDGEPVAGATQNPLQLTALTTAQSGWYAVRVSDGVGEVLSAAARLLVASPADRIHRVAKEERRLARPSSRTYLIVFSRFQPRRQFRSVGVAAALVGGGKPMPNGNARLTTVAIPTLVEA